MDYTELRTLKWISVVAGIASIVAAAALLERNARTILLCAGCVLFVVSLWFELKRDRLSALFSGVSRYFERFPTESNREVLAGVRKQYCYLGISFASAFPQFRQWYESQPPAGVRIRILLTDPSAVEVLEFQARYQTGLFQQNLSPEERRRIDDAVAGVRMAIRSTCRLLSALPDSATHIEVRLHREKLREWMYQVDGNLLYLGLLRKGENGLEAPVAVFRRKQDKWSLFDHFAEEWESLWEAAEAGTKAPGAGGAA